ncbi:MAG: EMC3/TMCO1 family protein [Candidatus Woesearchaeota archaeon]
MAFPLLNNFLNWLLNINPALSILFISFILSLIITLVNKFLTNQKLRKEIREDQIKLQKEIRTEKNNPKKLSKINTRLMEINLKYMNESMKATLFTLIPFWLVFGWLNTHMGYYPIKPNTDFTLTAVFSDDFLKNKSGLSDNNYVLLKLPENLKFADKESEKKELQKTLSWKLNGLEGIHKIELIFNNKTFEKEILISNSREYLPVEKSFKKCFLWSCSSEGLELIKIEQEQIKPFKDIPLINSIPWIGGFGWFGVYFLFSIIFSIVLRKVFKVY